MSIYDKASLVLIPSGTKTSKVYSQVPTNGDGDFTFSRSTAATRVNASGNIEKETQNLLLQSNSFDNWISNNTSETSGQSGYDGTNDAWLLAKSAASAYVYVNNSVSGVQTFSIYAKSGSLSWMRIVILGASDFTDAFFNLADGSLGINSGLISASSENIGGGWYRYSLALNGSPSQVRIYPADLNGNVSGTSGNILIQDAQREYGLVARDYIETTTTAIYGGITDNVPRLDYTDSSCPALLLEPQRTNLLPHSEYFNGWDTKQPSVTSNYGVSPEGVKNSTRLVFSGPSQEIRTAATSITGCTASVYIKGTSGETIKFGSSGSEELFTLNGSWQRIDKYNSGSPTNITINTYSGATARDIEVWGAQVEQGSYATSYIPTYGSAVTRNADAASKTGISSLIGQTEGSLFVEAKPIEANGDAFYQTSISDGTNNNAGLLSFTTTSGQVRFRFENGGIVQAQIYADGIDTSSSVKMAMAYKANDFVLYVNGVQAGTDTSGSIPSFSQIQFANGGNNTTQMYGSVNQVLLFKTRLSNEELATLTTI